jgi:pheromone a factor receptor
MCIARFLADIVSPRATAITRHDRRRRAIFDYLLSFGVPAVTMACHYIYQPNRFSVVRGVGCTITSNMSWPTLVLRTIWPPVFAIINVLYSSTQNVLSRLGRTLLTFSSTAYTVYRLIRHRRNFGRVVAGAHSALTTTRFIRLAALSFSYLLVGAPLTIYSTIINIRLSGRYLDYSWSYLHSSVSCRHLSFQPFSHPIHLQWELNPVTFNSTPVVPDIATWSDIIVGIIFFAAFGFGTEALSVYSRFIRMLGCGRRRDGDGLKGLSSAGDVTRMSGKSHRYV